MARRKNRRLIMLAPTVDEPRVARHGSEPLDGPKARRPSTFILGEYMMLRSILAVVITVAAATGGEGAEVKILAALAVQDALGPIGASFSRDSGHTAQIAYSTVGAIRERLAALERADVVILTADAVEEMHRKGQLSDPVPVAATRTGIA